MFNKAIIRFELSVTVLEKFSIGAHRLNSFQILYKIENKNFKKFEKFYCEKVIIYCSTSAFGYVLAGEIENVAAGGVGAVKKIVSNSIFSHFLKF